jgi:hypothetical protein
MPVIQVHTCSPHEPLKARDIQGETGYTAAPLPAGFQLEPEPAGKQHVAEVALG